MIEGVKSFSADIFATCENATQTIKAGKEKQLLKDLEELRSDWGVLPRHDRTNWKCLKKDNEWFETYSNIFPKLNANGCLIGLVGGRGNGKTQMAVQMMKQVTREQKRKARYITAFEFFARIKETWNEKSPKTERQIIEDFCKPLLLVIDEFGKRPEKEWQEQCMFYLLDQRYGKMKDTILIDNRSAKEFVAAIGPSLASRMNEGGGIVECKWESFR